MNQTRLFLLVAIAVVGVLLVQKWNADYSQPLSAPIEPDSATQPVVDVPSDVPTAPTAAAESVGDVPTAAVVATPTQAPALDDESLVVVNTDTMRLEISSKGATIRRVALKKFPIDTKHPDQLVTLVSPDPLTWHIPQSGLVSADNPAPSHEALYTSAQTSYELGSRGTLEVPFEWRDGDITVRKIYRFTPDSYVVSLQYDVINGGDSAVTMAPYRQLQRVIPPTKDSGFFLSNPETYAYIGAAMWAPETRFEKLKFDEFGETPLSRAGVKGSWTAMLQHHFLTAWIPDPNDAVTVSTKQLPATATLGTRYMVSQLSPVQSVAAGASTTLSQNLYVGPKEQSRLRDVAPGFDLAVDYGFFTFLSKPLFWLMDWLHNLVGNWGFAIILLTIMVRLSMYKLSEAQYRSGAKMRKLQPKIKQLQERYADDRQQLAVKQMELFKTEKANPMSGCLPTLLQIPVFIALYWVIFESVELRQAPFIFWIKDLTAPDPYFVLPLLNAAVMWVTTKYSPTPMTDPVQKMVFQSMPVIFAVLFAFFPAGLVLYWTVNGALGMVQQLYITRKIDNEDQRKVVARAK